MKGVLARAISRSHSRDGSVERLVERNATDEGEGQVMTDGTAASCLLRKDGSGTLTLSREINGALVVVARLSFEAPRGAASANLCFERFDRDLLSPPI